MISASSSSSAFSSLGSSSLMAAIMTGGGTIPSAERESERLGTRFFELDPEHPVLDGSALADQLIHPWDVEPSRPVGIEVGAGGLTGVVAVERDAERPALGAGARPHHEVHVPRMEPQRDPSARSASGHLLARDRPVALQRPLVEPELLRAPVGRAPVDLRATRRTEARCLPGPEVRLARS